MDNSDPAPWELGRPLVGVGRPARPLNLNAKASTYIPLVVLTLQITPARDAGRGTMLNRQAAEKRRPGRQCKLHMRGPPQTHLTCGWSAFFKQL